MRVKSSAKSDRVLSGNLKRAYAYPAVVPMIRLRIVTTAATIRLFSIDGRIFAAWPSAWKRISPRIIL